MESQSTATPDLGVSPTSRLCDTPIAIIGLGALYPRSTDLTEYWSNIVAAADCIEDVPETHWKIEDYWDPDPSAPDKTYAKRGGFIPTIDFNPLEFGLPPNQLEVTDVLQLLSLVVAKQTLADAGATGSQWYDPSRTGVILGITGANSLTQPLATRLQTPVLKEVVRSCGLSDQDAEEIAAKFAKAFAPWEENSFPGMLGNVVAGRIANRFDLGGTNCTVDAACASSLAAVHMAAAELVSGRADLMISGGCDAENTILMYLCFSKTPALSKSGIIRPFDENSDGTMIGEGMGMLALKRLADAERDGDRIYSVLRGIGTSSDGRFKSIYAPRKEGQIVALQRAYTDAGFGPEQVGLVECHGTGTAVGDYTELSALREVFAEASDEKQFCAVGSVKSQIGHTKAAAGAAGLIKLSLALHQKVLPPTINVETPKESVDFPNSPFWVNSETRPWVLEPGRERRRAASSSFGFGGTNFHCVLEEHDSSGSDLRALHRNYRVHMWHAESPQALLGVLADSPAGIELDAPIPADHARLAVVARTADELESLRDKAVERLRAELATGAEAARNNGSRVHGADSFELPGGAYYRRSAGAVGKIAALFAGQGSQYVGMGAQTAISVPPVRAAFDAASKLSDAADPLSRAIFPPPAFAREVAQQQEEALRRTDFAQPAIGALSAGQYRFLDELGFVPDGALGHSFGELTALWAAGALDDDQLHRLARARGAAMAQLPEGAADRGTMAALRCGPEQLTELLVAHPDVIVCNLNAPEQTVVGGGTAAVQAFAAAAKEQGMDAQLLPVAAAFHTSYVGHAVDAFRTAVAAEQIGVPAIPVFANSADAEYGADAEVNRDVLVEQLSKPVAFAPRIRQMYDAGYRVFIEFGPKSVLSGLVRKILADEPDVVVVAADAGQGNDGDRAIKQLAARLAVLGLPLTGLNRYSAEVPEVVETKGMRIPLNGINYVSEERRSSYQDALENGYQVSQPAPAAPANGNGNGHHAVEPVANGNHAPAPVADTAAPAEWQTRGDLAGDHLSLHREYLSSQLRVAERLSGILEHDARTGGPNERTVAGLASVSDHSVAIGQAHSHASEVMLGFAYLEAGQGISAPAIRRPIERLPRPELELGAQAELTAAPQAYAPAPSYAPAPQAVASAPQAVAPAPAAPAAAPTPAPQPVPAAQPAPAAAAPAAAPQDPAEVTEVVQEALLSIVSEKTGYPTDMLEVDMDVEADLGIDSIKRVEIMGALQERFPDSPQAAPEQMGELRTLGGIVAFISVAIGGSAVASTGAEAVHPKADGASRIARMQARLSALPVAAPLVGAYAAEPVALIAGPGGVLAEPLAAALAAAGWSVARGSEIPQGRLDLVLFLAPDAPAQWSESIATLEDALALAGASQRALERAAVQHRAGFLTVSRIDGILGLSGSTDAAALLGGLPGLVKTLAIEAPELYCRAVDLSPELTVEQAVVRLLDEIDDADTGVAEVGVAADGTRRTLLASTDDGNDPLLPHKDSVPEPTAADLLVVTGGGRGVTAACAIGLAERYGCGLLLLGRSALAAEPDWAAGIPENELKGVIVGELRASGAKPTPRDVERSFRGLVAGREIRATLTAIRATDATAEYLAVDVTDPAATAAALAPYRDRITGIVHGAGVLADKAIVDQRRDDVAPVLTTKLAGLASVLDAVDEAGLRHVVLFSSIAGFFGNRGQSSYACANEALNRIAATVGRRLPHSQVTSVNWGAWAGGMVTAQLERMFAERGVTLIPLETGVEFFTEEFSTARSTDVVCVVGPNAPLSVRAPRRMASGPTMVRRQLAAADPVLADHAVGGIPVLPATAAIGTVLGTAQRLTGQSKHLLRGFSVLKGVVFDQDGPTHLNLTYNPGADSTVVLVTDPNGRPRFRAQVLDRVPVAGTLTGLPDPVEPVTAYTDGVLFHGPALQGLRAMVAGSDGRLVLGCRLTDRPLQGGGFGTADYSPVLADLLLQAALVQVHRTLGLNSLPTAVGTVEVHDVLPSDADFRIVVEAVSTSGSVARTTVTAIDRDGRVLLRFGDVELVASDALGTKFAMDHTDRTA
ncbi:SDR family NAD(P)-dependent oxidoreductase [Nocardia sp. CA-107356]|uniref:SDR family NAD(P)-dependent oxidoreductase n=1 Tax=Nocardia sp. CA-107356 TaxID=3239972 RepID=UPI003D8B5475